MTPYSIILILKQLYTISKLSNINYKIIIKTYLSVHLINILSNKET